MGLRGAKRFYRDVAVAPGDGGFRVLLDGRPVRTPAGAFLVARSESLARAIASEWAGQGDVLDPKTMPLTALTNTVIDRIGPARGAVVAEAVRYASSDLLCYRADGPEELVRRQEREWQPLVDWASAHLGAAFRITSGVVAVDQPQAVLDAVAAAVRTFDDEGLAVFSQVMATTGSAVLALALLAGKVDADTAQRAAVLDEVWQSERWGVDREAEAKRQTVADDIRVAAAFLALCRDGHAVA